MSSTILSSELRDALNTAWKRLLNIVGFQHLDFDFYAALSNEGSSVTFTVDSSGSDTNFVGPNSFNLKTNAEAFSRLPPIIKNPIDINIAAGNFDGIVFAGISGGYQLAQQGKGITINGTMGLSSVATGVNEGVAGDGTSATSLVKPASAANWTSSDLVGKFVQIVGGGGYSGTPVVRAIIANNTTTITIDNISGLDNTSEFEIVEPATVLSQAVTNALSPDGTCVMVSDTNLPVVFRNLKFSAGDLQYIVYSTRNSNITLEGCLFDSLPEVAAVNSLGDHSFSIKNCVFTNQCEAVIEGAMLINVHAVWLDNGSIILKDSHKADVKVNAVDCASNALYLRRVNFASIEGKADSCDVTPFYFESVGYLEAVGTNKITGSGNTGYGVEFVRSGRYSLMGCNATGSSGDILFDGSTGSWSQVTDPGLGVYMKYGGTLIAEAAQAKAFLFGNYAFEGDVSVGGRFFTFGYRHETFTDNLVAHAGGGSASATPLGLGISIVRTVASADDSVILPGGAAIGGVVLYVKNLGANSCRVFPPSGGTVDGTTHYDMAVGESVMFISTDNAAGKDFVTFFPVTP